MQLPKPTYLPDGTIVATRIHPNDDRYVQVCHLSKGGDKILESDGPWPSGDADERHRAMVDKKNNKKME